VSAERRDERHGSKGRADVAAGVAATVGCRRGRGGRGKGREKSKESLYPTTPAHTAIWHRLNTHAGGFSRLLVRRSCPQG
jgi:hypothetical protein